MEGAKIMKYYKDTAGNVYAYNAIQKHRAGLVALCIEETLFLKKWLCLKAHNLA